MRGVWAGAGLLIGLGLGFGGRALWAAPEIVPIVTPQAAPPTPVRRVVTRFAAAPSAPEAAAPLPPDVARAEAVVAALYGEVTPWDDPEARARAQAAWEEGFVAIEAAGAGSIRRIDCAAWPCVGSVVVEGGFDALEQGLQAHLPDVDVWAQLSGVVVDGRTVDLALVEQRAPDASPWDPVLQMRKLELEIEATAPPLDPADPGLREPLVWPEWAPR